MRRGCCRRRSSVHALTRDLPTLLRAGDVLVVNETRVLPARLVLRKPTGGQVEVLALEEPSPSSRPQCPPMQTDGGRRS